MGNRRRRTGPFQTKRTSNSGQLKFKNSRERLQTAEEHDIVSHTPRSQTATKKQQRKSRLSSNSKESIVQRKKRSSVLPPSSTQPSSNNSCQHKVKTCEQKANTSSDETRRLKKADKKSRDSEETKKEKSIEAKSTVEEEWEDCGKEGDNKLALQLTDPKKCEAETRGKNAPPHLKAGDVLGRRFKIERMKSGGGFAQIYKAYDMLNNDRTLAVKVEPKDKEAGRIILEQRVLTRLRSRKHIPTLIASGEVNGAYLFIVMQMLGRNLHDLRQRQSRHRFTVGTALRVGIQMLTALQTMHNVGYLHRDIKPSNMCVGVNEMNRTVYLVDFGMTRKFRSDKGELRKRREFAEFRGTARYVSINVHERKDQGPNDDLWAFLYSLIELGEGSLPWKRLENPEEMAEKKKKTPFVEMLMHLPRSLKQFATNLDTLQYDSIPDYNTLNEILVKCVPADVKEDSQFDWENTIVESKSLERVSIMSD